MTSSPSKTTWTVAGASLVIVAALLYGGNLFVKGLHYALLRQELLERVTSGNESDEILTRQRLSALSALPARNARRVIDFVSAVERDDDLSEIESPTQSEEFPKLALAKRLDQWKKNLSQVQHSLDDVKGKLRVVESRQASLSKVYTLLKEDFEGLLFRAPARTDEPEIDLHVENEDVAPNNSDVKLSFYSEGIFQGLPQVEQIPDNITDERALAPYLGGTFRPMSAGMHARLLEIKGEAAGLVAQNEELTQQRADLSGELKKLRQNHIIIRTQTLHVSGELLAIIALSRPAPAVVGTYGAMRQFGEQVGYTFPELPLEV